jgi:hypothetical protein
VSVLIALVLLAAVGLLAALAFAGVKVGRQAAELQRVQRRSASTRLDVLYEFDQARARLTASAAQTQERRAALDARLAELGRARASLALLFEAAAEALRLVRVPR